MWHNFLVWPICLSFLVLVDAIPFLEDDLPPQDDFQAFVAKHNKVYHGGRDEYSARRQFYHKHAAEVHALNRRPGKMWSASLNHLADWSDSELRSLRGRKGPRIEDPGSSTGTSLLQSNVEVPEEKDWSKLKILSRAPDQGPCGSCWAVATTRMLAAHSEIYMGANSRNFSTQELVDCVPNPHSCGGQGGCEGATVTLAMNYVSQHGVNFIKDYGYTGKTQKCRAVHDVALANAKTLSNDEVVSPGIHLSTDAAVGTQGVHFGMQAWERLPVNKEMPMLVALTHGPVAVSIAASGWSFYESGIFDDCPKDIVLDHAVLLVGYGKDKLKGKTTKYWKIQNSWGPEWGEAQGTMRILRHDSEEAYCGIDNDPQAGSGCEGGPKEITVCGSCGIINEGVVSYFSKPS
eukprot:gnl/TRDRNA2_/TRDRNA2_181299_c0_seq1.p1 gnl/TRDRNA2_/TRDRNA2_181299_c0~~gnl/TRDRNA2_/TRDRNA2_181299_c0_seq1.p1  ORF type:complete len:404 (-),score=61.73 gnl/TRDRNA2_/TRDRNA2_181299_c0_seq1:165-1376(-)